MCRNPFGARHDRPRGVGLRQRADDGAGIRAERRVQHGLWDGRRRVQLAGGYISLVGNARFGQHTGGSSVLPGRQFQFALTYRF
jgi:hypothetical protein